MLTWNPYSVCYLNYEVHSTFPFLSSHTRSLFAISKFNAIVVRVLCAHNIYIIHTKHFQSFPNSTLTLLITTFDTHFAVVVVVNDIEIVRLDLYIIPKKNTFNPMKNHPNCKWFCKWFVIFRFLRLPCWADIYNTFVRKLHTIPLCELHGRYTRNNRLPACLSTEK